MQEQKSEHVVRVVARGPTSARLERGPGADAGEGNVGIDHGEPGSIGEAHDVFIMHESWARMPVTGCRKAK